MKPDGRQAQNCIAGRDLRGVGQSDRIDDPDDRPGQIEFSGAVNAGHLGGFAAEKRAVVRATRALHARDDLARNVGIELAHRKVVEEKQRGCVHDQNVVDAVIDEVRADGSVALRMRGDQNLRADAVGRTDEQPPLVAR